MAIYEHATTFAGKPVVDWEPGSDLADPRTTIPRISLPYDAGEVWGQRFAAFLQTPGAEEIPGLVVGTWDASGASEDTAEAVVEVLVASSNRLLNLRAIFLGDIISEESEISWIQQTDVSPLFAAYPNLEHFRVRGGNGLSLGRPRLAHLASLVVESGGLPASVVREVGAADLPALTHLELWLGEEDYGGNASIDDLSPIFRGDRFPQLSYLGLRDSDRADEIAVAVAQAPVLERIRILDLSLGTLTDTGAAALLSSPAVRRLQRLDIHHHFCTPSAVRQIEELGIEVDASDPQEPYESDGEMHRYVAVGE
ncbi:MAG TPA: STM4015 family protein [Herpetosiphonaceae bacterium]|nr:STM4015 family protein [Herpetosiphonaceae bacterium]